MKKILLLAACMIFAACASHHEDAKPVSPVIEKKGGFVVEHHEAPMIALDNIQTLDNIQQFAKKIYFKQNSARITPDSRKILNGLIGMMQIEPAYTVHIVGLADETEKKPMTLSMRRALSVAQLLRSNGIKASRIRVNGQGRDSVLGCSELKGNNRQNCLAAERAVVLTNKY